MGNARGKSRIREIIPFAAIWVVFGVVYTMVVRGTLGESKVYPATGIPYDFLSSLIITTICCVLMGLIMGLFETRLLGGLFRSRPFWFRVGMKALLYTSAIVIFLQTINILYLSHVLGAPAFTTEVIGYIGSSFTHAWFWSIVLYIGAVATVALLLAEYQLHVGRSVLRNFFTGRYQRPQEEERIFMFLDMKSSTTIAEQMGNLRYFDLLKRYYADMTEAIMASSGEICQYVGDEVVLTWTLEEGLRDQDCLACFFRIKRQLQRKAAEYTHRFGMVPDFKAGLHCGHVTTGELGTLRKDIVFSGDVMNTTARIQSLCNDEGADLLISEALLVRLGLNGQYVVREVGVRTLKGKDERVKLYAMSEA